MSSGGGSRSSLCSSSNRSHFCFLVNQRHCQGRRPLHLAHAREDDGDKKVDWSTRLWREWRAGGTRRRWGRRRGHNISSVFFVVTGVAEPLPSTLGVSELHDNKRRSVHPGGGVC